MTRVFFLNFSSKGHFPDGRVKLDVHFRDSAGNEYIWTPDWEQGTRNFFLEAYRIERLNVPSGPERGRFKQTAETVLEEERSQARPVNFKLLATKIGEGLKYDVSLNQIQREASAILNFPVSAHPNDAITSQRSQVLYNWVITLGQQPIPEREKLHLLKELIEALAPEGSPVRNLIAGLW